MSFLTAGFLLLVSIACFVQAETNSAAIPLEKTMGNTTRDKDIFLGSCYTAIDVVGDLPCEELWKNHAEGKFEENLELRKKYGFPDNWMGVNLLSRSEAHATLFEGVSVPLFNCYTSQITNANQTLPVEEMRINYLYNRVAANDEILEKLGALQEGDNTRKGELETIFQNCLRRLTADAFKSKTAGNTN